MRYAKLANTIVCCPIPICSQCACWASMFVFLLTVVCLLLTGSVCVVVTSWVPGKDAFRAIVLFDLVCGCPYFWGSSSYILMFREPVHQFAYLLVCRVFLTMLICPSASLRTYGWETRSISLARIRV